MGEWRYRSILDLDTDEWSNSHRGRFVPAEKTTERIRT
jgi:hypothetical protein